jgi:hypothetical protein
MPATPAKTPDTEIVEHLLKMAHAIEIFGLWTGGPNYIDPASERLDIPAAAYRTTTGTLPFIFAVPTHDAAEVARSYIEATPAAMDVLNAIAAHMANTWPDLDWTDDPIERLSHWPDLLGASPAEIPQTLRDLAHSLMTAATAPAAA